MSSIGQTKRTIRFPAEIRRTLAVAQAISRVQNLKSFLFIFCEDRFRRSNYKITQSFFTQLFNQK
jgi:hypothetical protein